MKSKKLVVAFILSVFSFGVLAESKVCFKKELSVYCEDELEGMKSLNGNFFYNRQYYDFSARRAFSNNWCETTRLKIKKIMSRGEFCMTFDEQLSNVELTINSVDGAKASWSYFK